MSAPVYRWVPGMRARASLGCWLVTAVEVKNGTAWLTFDDGESEPWWGFRPDLEDSGTRGHLMDQVRELSGHRHAYVTPYFGKFVVWAGDKQPNDPQLHIRLGTGEGEGLAIMDALGKLHAKPGDDKPAAEWHRFVVSVYGPCSFAALSWAKVICDAFEHTGAGAVHVDDDDGARLLTSGSGPSFAEAMTSAQFARPTASRLEGQRNALATAINRIRLLLDMPGTDDIAAPDIDATIEAVRTAARNADRCVAVERDRDKLGNHLRSLLSAERKRVDELTQENRRLRMEEL
jgi:hypothetical protein